MKKCFVLISVLLVTSMFSITALSAQDLRSNEDLKYIRTWKHNSKAAGLAATLNLSADQVQNLRTYRQSWDQVNAEMEPQINAAKTALTDAAAGIRKQLEGGALLSVNQEDQLKQLRRDLRRLNQEKRLKARLALNGIEDVLQEDQKASLKAFMRQQWGRRGEANRMQANRMQPGNTGRLQNNGRAQILKRAKRAAVRLILSDGFLNAYP